MQPFYPFCGIIVRKMEGKPMNQWENDFLNLENELLFTRKKLNDLIFEYQNTDQNKQDKAIYQDKLRYLEVELQYINNQLQLLKKVQSDGIPVSTNMDAQIPPATSVQSLQNHEMVQNTQTIDKRQVPQNANNTNAASSKKQSPYITSAPSYANPQPGSAYAGSQPNSAPTIPQPAPVNTRMRTAPAQSTRKTLDYEKLFGKNLMGIFASILIFISLVIFATLILPHLTDTLKMLAMYIASAAVLSAGLLLYRKNKDNLFYIAIIGCGAGSLYLSLLLSNLHFKVIGDLALYGLILLWAVFVKYLTKIKNLVFNIIGQAGIFIASVLGTALCVSEHDTQKFFVLTIFYFISAVVFSNIGRTYLQSLFRLNNNETEGTMPVNGTSPYSNAPIGNAATETNNGQRKHTLLFYESNLCIHICKTLNIIVYTIGLAALSNYAYVYSDSEFSAPSLLIALNALLFMGCLVLEFAFSYVEECKHGLAFQILSTANVILLVCLFNATRLLPREWTFVFLYLVSVAELIYVEMKGAEYKLYAQIWCFGLLFTGCINNSFIVEHLYVYLTVVPFMLYGKWKKDNIYLGAGVVYLAGLPLYVWSTYDIKETEALIMLAVLYVVFLYVSRKTDQTWFKIAGYIALCVTTMTLVYDISCDFLESRTGYNLMGYHGSESSGRASLREAVHTYARLGTFFVLAVVHLILNKLEYFGKEKTVERVMLGINALLMIAGCSFMYDADEMIWKLPVILITILLFVINSKKLLPRHKYAGYYVALKYTVLMLCILGSYDVVDYATSICLLVFAIISIVTGFYMNTTAFRLYGLVLSMISIVKLIMIDIKYDSTIENAVSFFVSGVLCFVISFIYNKIDSKMRGK